MDGNKMEVNRANDDKRAAAFEEVK